jgi:hypothetical protein
VSSVPKDFFPLISKEFDKRISTMFCEHCRSKYTEDVFQEITKTGIRIDLDKLRAIDDLSQKAEI